MDQGAHKSYKKSLYKQLRVSNNIRLVFPTLRVERLGTSIPEGSRLYHYEYSQSHASATSFPRFCQVCGVPSFRGRLIVGYAERIIAFVFSQSPEFVDIRFSAIFFLAHGRMLRLLSPILCAHLVLAISNPCLKILLTYSFIFCPQLAKWVSDLLNAVKP